MGINYEYRRLWGEKMKWIGKMLHITKCMDHQWGSEWKNNRWAIERLKMCVLYHGDLLCGFQNRKSGGVGGDLSLYILWMVLYPQTGTLVTWRSKGGQILIRERRDVQEEREK